MRDDARFKLNQIRTLIQRWEKSISHQALQGRDTTIYICPGYSKIYHTTIPRQENIPHIFFPCMTLKKMSKHIILVHTKLPAVTMTNDHSIKQ